MLKGGLFKTGYTNKQYALEGMNLLMELMGKKSVNPFDDKNLKLEKAKRLELLKEVLRNNN